MSNAAPSFRSSALPGDVVAYRAAFGALTATSFAKLGDSPSEWIVTREAPRARPRIERLDLAGLRHGGFHSQCRALASVIKHGLAGRM